jgi:hypothetical protein
MSLISEALKKARQEAARQDSLRQGVPYAVGAVDPPQRRNPLMPLLAGLGAGCLLAGLLFGGAWIAGVGPFDKPARDTTQVAQAPAVPVGPTVAPQEATPAPVVTEIAPPAPTPPPVTPTPVPEERPQPVVETRPAPPVEQPVVSQTAPPLAPAPVEERPAIPAPAPPPSIQIQPTPSRPVPVAPIVSGGLEEGKVYAGEVPVPGGGSLKLNGIAFSQDQPIVVLDGRVMGPGEVIQGFTVVEIQSDRVKLQGHGATVFVTTK